MHSKERKHAVIFENVSLKIDICKKDIGCGDSRDCLLETIQDLNFRIGIQTQL